MTIFGDFMTIFGDFMTKFGNFMTIFGELNKFHYFNITPFSQLPTPPGSDTAYSPDQNGNFTFFSPLSFYLLSSLTNRWRFFVA